MLRAIEIKEEWRSLRPGFWPKGLPMARRTVIYGHNGSGKSTFAELLLSIAEGEVPVDAGWEDESRSTVVVKRGGPTPSPGMAVFTRKWVEANLAAFLNGEDASAIVTLGREAIEAQEEEERLAQLVAALDARASDQENQLNDVDHEIRRRPQVFRVTSSRTFDPTTIRTTQRIASRFLRCLPGSSNSLASAREI